MTDLARWITPRGAFVPLMAAVLSLGTVAALGLHDTLALVVPSWVATAVIVAPVACGVWLAIRRIEDQIQRGGT